ncbi:MAG: hypothetical protein DI601_17370 [Azospirillum brasilense]|nr:MAG: hypothetical protein DI601_17370 [Azospirillum brasilense]
MGRFLASDRVRRALETADIVLLSTDKGEGVLLLHDVSADTVGIERQQPSALVKSLTRRPA